LEPQYFEESPRREAEPEAEAPVPPDVAYVLESQQSRGNAETTRMLEQHEEKAETSAPKGTARPQQKAELDGEIKRLLDEAATAIPPAEGTLLSHWTTTVIRQVDQAHTAKFREFKRNAAEKYVKDLGYERYPERFKRETRATVDPSAISNPGFTQEEKLKIAEFLRDKNKRSPTVRPPTPIVVGEWSIVLHYDLAGAPHGPTHTPHVQFAKDKTKKGKQRYVGDHTRGMTFDETRELMDKPGENPSWAVEWAKQEVGES
jgi:hypothetical protein